MSTSQKHQNFISEAMKDKSVTDIAGIGPTCEARLTEKGFDKAYILLGQYLLLKKDETMFTEYVKEITRMNSKHAKNCYDCLKEWAEFNI